MRDERSAGKKSRVAADERGDQQRYPREGGYETVAFFEETKVPIRASWPALV